MKKFIFALFAIVIATPAWAQYDNFSIENAELSLRQPVLVLFGPRLGFNYSTVGGDDASDRGYIFGFVLGGTLEVQTRSWYSTTLDILVSQQGYKLKSGDQSEVLTYVIAPVMANFYLTDRLIVKAGVQPSLLAGAQLLVRNEPRRNSIDDWRRFDLAIPVGVSYMLQSRIVIDLRYTHSLTNSSADRSCNYRNSSISLTASYKF